ncbi:hypothetical protein PtB15_15B43 [Puccinia triticina]|nr:hypothetical protein PtB15_15B43 [Puccinia triticina]
MPGHSWPRYQAANQPFTTSHVFIYYAYRHSNSTTSSNSTVTTDPTPTAPEPPQIPISQPMRYANPSSPSGPNSSAVLPPPPAPVDRSSTPLGQGYSRNGSNIFTSSAPTVASFLYPALLRLLAQIVGLVLPFVFFF